MRRFRQAQAELAAANRARVREARAFLESWSARKLARAQAENRAEIRAEQEMARSEGEESVRQKTRARTQEAAVERGRSVSGSAAAEARRQAEATRAAAQAHVREQRDGIELSRAARQVAEGPDEARAERVRELQAEHDAGRLNTPERIERAAQRLLGD